MALLLIVLCVAFYTAVATTSGSTNHTKQHTSQNDFWSSIRLKPVTVMSVEKNIIYWSFEDTHEVKLGSFVTDENTQLPPTFNEKPKGKYIAILCSKHDVVYDLIPTK